MNKQTTYKLLIIACLAAINLFAVRAQTVDDFGRITLRIQIPADNNLPQEARILLETRMREMITHFGVGSSSINSRFVMEARVNVLSKDIVPGPPQRVSQRVEISFFMGDVVKQKVFSSAAITQIGVGTNENTSFIASIRQINPRNERFGSMINEGKAGIIAFYQMECESILREAESLAVQGNFSRAIFNLAQIPDVCTECYQRGLELQGQIFTRKIESEGMSAFTQAKAIWAESPNSQGAGRVSRLISRINPRVSFIQDVNLFASSVSAVVQEQELREWQQRVQEYNDRLEDARLRADRDHELRMQQQDLRAQESRDRAETARLRADRQHELEQMRIQAFREIAVEYARNQPQTVYRPLVVR